VKLLTGKDWDRVCIEGVFTSRGPRVGVFYWVTLGHFCVEVCEGVLRPFLCVRVC